MSAGEDGGEDLFDHLVLPDDHFLQLALHDQPMLPKFLEYVAEIARQSVVLAEGGGRRDGRDQNEETDKSTGI